MQDRGFTLIEVLVSMAVLGMTLGLIIVLMGQGLRTVRRTEGYSRALLLARERMDDGMRTAGLDLDVEEGVVRGSRDYHWEKRVVPLSSDESSQNVNSESTKPSLYRVEVKIHWSEGSKEKELALESVAMSRPQEDEGDE